MTARILLLVRHAKSSWKHPELDDIDRPLNKRGRRDAPEMGRRLSHRKLIPDLVLCSPAVRTKATAEAIAAEVGYSADQIVINDDLYAASEQEVLDAVASTDDRVRTLMVVTHNPVITDLANRFSPTPIDNVPTCGVLTVTLESWTRPELGVLADFDYPKREPC
ncbi:SixA phosphatase family protein [Fuerstiella marisgermanici]|uniref:Phosphohistidine phosphatase n=1 Tax=Fuerstiella marisgermanici TaxID=1891926 RepID=A0A1P8WED3_9PLAN|nr:histidine phosphatase family protein [Fuerstiella marisgermanici]APZ92400.1 phosphohistidine phosphatase [Fuerstiella marisgermanici]